MLCLVWHDTTEGEPVRIEEVVGRRIREAREARGMSQEEFGELLAEYLGRPWPRQAMSAAEKGQRSFTAVELVAFSVIIGCHVADLFRLPGDVEALHMPGEALTRERLNQVVASDEPAATELREMLLTLERSAESLQETGSGISRAAQKALTALDQVLMSAGHSASE